MRYPALGPKGKVAAAGLQAATVGLHSMTAAVGAFATRGKELAGLDGRLAGATARAGAREYQSDLRESSVLSEKLSRIIENQSKSEAVFKEIMLPIRGFILDVLNGAVEGGMGLLAALIEAVRDAGAKIGVGDETLDRMSVMLKKVKEIMEGGGDEKGMMPSLLAQLDGFIAPPAGPAPARPGPPPLFGGIVK